MSRIFVTSDTHFGHKNIIRFVSRPFASQPEMDTYMINRWNALVADDDIIYFLGDFGMGPPATDGFIADKMSMLHGKKRVVLGNHDRPVPKFGTSGLKKIVEDYSLEVEILDDIHEVEIDGTHFVMCHYPMNDWNGKFHGAVHLHGHQHNGYSASHAREMKGKKRYDVGVDMYGGPVEITGDLRFLNDPKGWKV